jgi:SpoVK/Ycf46/Vps4 family AAA+-type ATPase
LRAEHDKPTDPQGKQAKVRTDLKGLARRIRPTSSWDDLVLSEDRVNILREIALHVRHGLQTDNDRGSQVRKSRPGVTVGALFAGPGGTGKKLAAKVIASELQSDLYQVDLELLLSTPEETITQNLRHLFTAAAQSRAVLLFEDAARFFVQAQPTDLRRERGDSTSVSQTAEKRAPESCTSPEKIPVLLLRNLQELGGVMILVTETGRAIPESFQRKLDFVLSFPFPDAAQREQIWRRVLPPRVPTSGLDLVRLARIEMPGGHIRDIAQMAIHLASEQQEPVRMQHLRRAAESIYEKLGLSMSLGEFQYWL